MHTDGSFFMMAADSKMEDFFEQLLFRVACYGSQGTFKIP